MSKFPVQNGLVDVGPANSIQSGLMTPDMLMRLNNTGLANGGTLNFYVDTANGSDNNDGFSTTSALQTIGAVYKRFSGPSGLGTDNATQVVINLLPNGSAEQNFNASSIILHGGSAITPTFRFVSSMVTYTPSQGPSTAALDVTPATTVQLNDASGSAFDARTQFNFVTAAPNWAVNSLVGRFIRVKRAGVLRYYELPIAENTANTITVDTTGIVGDLLSTDVVDLVTPGAVIVGVDPTGAASRLAIHGVATAPSVGTSGSSPNTFLRIRFGSTVYTDGFMSFDRCSWVIKSLNSYNAFPNFQNCAFYFAFVNLSGVSNIIAVASVSDGASVPQITIPQVTLSMFDSQLFIGSSNTNNLSNAGAGGATAIMQGNIGLWGTTNLGGARLIIGVGSLLTYETNQFQILHALMGSNPTSPGIQVGTMGRLRIAAVSLALRGPAGADLKVATGAAIALGTGAGQFMEAAGFNGNFTRVLEGTATAPTGDPSAVSVF